MLIHQNTLNIISKCATVEEHKEMISTYTFFLFMKSRINSSVIYFCHNNPRKNFNEQISEKVKMDYRTFKKGMDLLFKHGLIRRWGDHVKLVSLEKDFDFRLKENGKPDRKWKSKFFRIKISEKDSMRQCRNIVRGLLVKVSFKIKYLAQVFRSTNQISEKEEYRRKLLSYDFRSRRNVTGDNLTVKMGVKQIGRLMKVSTSSVSRIVSELQRQRIVVKVKGQIKSLGAASDLKVPVCEVRKKVYGAFVYNGQVLKQECHSYVF